MSRGTRGPAREVRVGKLSKVGRGFEKRCANITILEECPPLSSFWDDGGNCISKEAGAVFYPLFPFVS